VTTVALDAFGADRGPGEVGAGAAEALTDGVAIRLFGPAGLPAGRGVELIETEEWIDNSDEPVAAVRSRPEASIVRAARDVAGGGSQALVSAGSTGATMTAALFAFKRIRGVQRPGLAVLVPVPGAGGKPVLLLDCGANAEARPQHLVQFAFLGSAFSEAVLGVSRPRVGLLSVGEEASKGRPEVIAAHEVLAGAPGIRFEGNAEGRDIVSGDFDVVVTDGFTGNVALKTLEGTAKAVAGAVREAATSNPMAMAGGLLLRPALGRLRRTLDPNATGGAILLGVRGVAVVAHGSSTAAGIAAAVRLADRAVRERAIERMEEALAGSGAGRAALRERARESAEPDTQAG
jgi:glycerol-3-phosphate acyltransferase PlsX